MINGQLKSDMDSLWNDFWSGGITNPLSVIEQISLQFNKIIEKNGFCASADRVLFNSLTQRAFQGEL